MKNNKVIITLTIFISIMLTNMFYTNVFAKYIKVSSFDFANIDIKYYEIGVYAKLYDTNNDGIGDTLVLNNTPNFTYSGNLINDYNNENCSSSKKWSINDSNIKKVEVINEIKPISTKSWFQGFTEINEITNIDKINTINTKTMYAMFTGCTKITNIDLTCFNVSNVTDVRYMFSGCSALKSINISNWSTTNITTMRDMFNGCKSLTSLNVTSFDTSNVTDMHAVFGSCASITSLDLSGFDTANVTNMSYMFYDSTKLKTIYVSKKFVTTKVADSDVMFTGCTSLVGGEGTRYSASYIDKTYARIDENMQAVRKKGYFTYKVGPQASYIVKHYQMNLDGINYTLKNAENLVGIINSTVSPSTKQYEGFTSPETKTVTVLADNSTTVEYYYTRNKYDFTIKDTTGTVTTGSSSNGSYYYGEEIILKSETQDDYHFDEWSNGTTNANCTITMPAENLDIKPMTYYAPIKDGLYKITSDLNGSMAVDNDANSGIGANVQLWEYNGNSTMKWNVIYQAKGYYTIISSRGDGTKFRLHADGTTSGSNVSANNTNIERELWKFEKSYANGFFKVIPKCNNSLFLDVHEANDKNGTNIKVYVRNQVPAQNFKFTYLSAITASFSTIVSN